MQKKLKNLDWTILLCCLLLVGIGMVTLASATADTNQGLLLRQFLSLLVGLLVMTVTIMIDYKTIARLSPILYGVVILLLIGVLFTPPINGSSRWFTIGSQSVQPSELSKITVVIFLGFLMSKLKMTEKKQTNMLWKLGMILGALAVPVFLIALEPDIGTSIPMIVAVAFMLYVGGIHKRVIFIAAIGAVIMIPLLYFTVLPEHAKSRIDIFLNPGMDPRGKGYNIIQSKIAIGAGKLTGMGLYEGNQTQLRILKPKNDRLYLLRDWRRNGLFSRRLCYCAFCRNHCQISLYCKNRKR